MFKKKTKVKESLGDRIMLACTTVLLLLVLIIVGYPVIYVISSSFSSAAALSAGKVLLWPVDITFAGYEFVFQYQQIWIGFRNSLFYTTVSTCLTLFMYIIYAYPLSKSHFQGRGMYTAILMFTSLFSAGLIPTYIVRSSLGLKENIWAVVTLGLVASNGIIILRTAFKSSIPGELFDAAEIDGANDFQCLTKIAIPLAKASISVITLYAIVGCWNEYFNSMIYLGSRKDLWPLTLYLRTILAAGQTLDAGGTSSGMQELLAEGTQQVKYCLIIVSTAPVLAAYAVVQKYFKKGVMVGSVKG